MKMKKRCPRDSFNKESWGGNWLFTYGRFN
jgi:hypothetical protein